MKRKVLLILMSFLAISLTAQETNTVQERKSIPALRISTPLHIDGVADEEVYNLSEPAKDFLQLQPYNGRPAYQPSEVHIFYDQTAIYVGAILYDSSPDSIHNFLSERDNIGYSDYFGIYFDPYNQGQMAFGFFVTPAGVQTDIKAIKSNGGDSEDSNWNAVWESRTSVTDQGWIVEMKIPYSALRFSEGSSASWGMNMFRNIRRYNSNSSWNFIDVEVSGFIHQQGNLAGISDIKPPVRLSLSPYAALYAEKKDGSSSDFIYKGGMDLKYGISESFTLDMMLIPDFGQIQSDDKELNLSPYEMYYSEKRQFFTEGTELFDRSGLLYSRRIGAKPKFSDDAEDALAENEEVDYLPTETQLVNASKISGRTTSGFGVGFLNAMTLPSKAILKDTITGNEREILVQPFTNYNLTVLDKTLPNNSFIGIINSSVLMANNPFMANVSGTQFQLRNKAKTYAVGGKAGISYRGEEEKETGYFAELSFDKNSGKFQYGISQSVNSDKFNINDLGYMRRNNEMITSLFAVYQINEPFSVFRRWYLYTEFEHYRMYNPSKASMNQYVINSYAQFKNNYGAEITLALIGNQHDYYEPRVKGRYYFQPWGFQYNLYFHTDNRKALVANFNFGDYKIHGTGEYNYWGGTNFNLRIGRRYQMNYSISFGNHGNDRGYIDKEGDSIIYFARRDVKTIENIIGSSYILSNKAGLTLRVRHYWSGADNKEYFTLQENGSLNPDYDYDENKNANYNAITIDFNFRWIFAPGSELSVSWKNAVYEDSKSVNCNYVENFCNTWKSDQANSFSVKLLYYIDYNSLRKKS